MADWLRVFVLSPHIRVLAVNEAKIGGAATAVRLEARVFGHTVEATFTHHDQAIADYEFGRLSDESLVNWLASEGEKREADHARCL